MPTEILPDNTALRSGRRERALAHMAAHDLDVLVLGRSANVRYVTGARQLWVAGTRPFGPSCVLVRETGAIYLVSTWDEGVPDDIPHERLFGLTWNPMHLVDELKGIEGAATARRVGTDAMSPNFARLLPLAFPAADLVDGESAMRAARRIKTPDEVTALRAALKVAEDSLAAAVAELRPGVTKQQLSGVLLEAAAAKGVTTPSTQEVVWITSHHDGNSTVHEGDLVAFTVGVVAGGYIGEVGRTWSVGGAAHDGLYRRWEDLRARLIAACRPGAHGSDLIAAYEACGEPLPSMPVARGLGLGFDPPVITPDLPRTADAEVLEPGMVLTVTSCVWQEGSGTVIGRDAVLITADGPEVLTRRNDA
ncbi:MAG TPA: M24 family metallopeptidase [Actinospica sp.]|jgi:Xaa-Pro aminopeptidase|nr:M24 family metallopeptidase [Actinospica sp.]